MDPSFNTVGLIGKYNSPEIAGPLLKLGAYLSGRGVKVIIDRLTASNIGDSPYPVLTLDRIGHEADLAIVLGGDGTMLGFGRKLAPHGVPLIGINQGRLGFITDIPLDQIEQVLRPMLRGQYEVDDRALMHGKVWRDGHCVFEALAMNDVVVNRGSTAGMVELRVEVDGHFVARQRADGLIISSPTGSTAYSLSAGGPIMHPGVGGWALVPIAPHTLSNRPLVLAEPAEIVIEMVAGRDASANFDMQSLASLKLGDQVKVRASPHQAVFLHPQGWSYFDTLRQKLHWNEGGS